MPLRDDLLNPIPGENPSGANLRYDPVTDKIKEGRREDLDVPQGEWKTALKTADYPQVIKLAGEAVAKRGKDLQIAVWLVDAHVRKDGFAVLAPAFDFLRDLLEQFWDSLYPPLDEDGDMEVRAAPLVWLGSKLGEPLGFLPIVSGKLSWNKYQESRTVGYEADADTGEKQEKRETAIREGKVTADQFDEAADATSVAALRETYKQLGDAQAALESLSEWCDTKFGDFTPSFIKTREAIDEIAQTVRIILGRKPGGLDEPSAPVDEDFSVSPAAEVESAPPVAEEPQAPAAQPAEADGVGRQLAAICRTLRGRDPEDPAPYLILRNFAWAGMLYRAPMLDRSAIVAPESELRIRLKRLTADSEWDKVLEATEAAMLQPCSRFWLDLQRYTTNALEEKGYPGVGRVVTGQVRLLLEALPEILDLTFPDDTPAANSETRNWIENYVIIRSVPAPAAPDSASSTDETPADSDSPEETPPETNSSEASAPEAYAVEENPPILEAEQPPPADTSDEFAAALQAVRNGRTAEGLGMITTILATERSGRARFRRRTQLAHLLMAAGKGKVAQSLLDQLAAEIEERRLEEWETGEAMAYPLELLLHCLTPADDERRSQLYTRICRLDPVRAVNCPI
jgi:type VI secretion system protein ImpA